ncbi:pyridoxamine 5'-phosphate oxidase family protein, partial [Staphylococcus aureus]|uniref:pyridoxamine 5'-phosphate oxidase family protein n=1 Tax=Staphylococcus aureus TaxID=1280 RepID=UPI0039BEC21A
LDPISTLGNYYAFAPGPVPYDKEAQTYDQAYQQTSDTFKRHDLLPALQAKIDQAIAAAKAADGHVRVSYMAQLGHYDFATHTFTFAIPFDSKMYLNPAFPSGGAQSDVNVTFADSPKFNQVTITDEAKAREIEDAVNKA